MSILDFLFNLNKNTSLFIKDLTSGIKENIKNEYRKKIGIDELYTKIETISLNIFEVPYEYLKNLKDYLSSPCGPWSNIMKIIDEEILYNEDKKPYYFDYISYDKDYKELYHEIYENYLNEKEQFLNNLFIPNHIKNKLYIELSDFINETFINLEEKLLNLSLFISYEFLDINYNVTEMIYNTF